MKIIICGAGLVGLSVARQLAKEKNEVVIIDHKKELIDKVSSNFNIKAVLGFGSSPFSLEAAGAFEADMLIAVTHQDEVNMIACQIAHSLFKVRTKIARIRNQDYLKERWRGFLDDSSIDIAISPEIEVARSISRRLNYPGTFEVIEFFENKVLILGFVCDANCNILNTQLRQLTELFPDLHCTVMGIIRKNKIIIPHGQDQIFEGDSVYIATTPQELQRTLKVFGNVRKRAKNIIIAGGGSIGFNVAENLEKKSGMHIKIIESNRERAILVSERLNRTIVLHGSALERELLIEAGAQTADTFLALTNDDQVNILSASIIRRIKPMDVLSLVNNENLVEAFKGEYHRFIEPRGITISRILARLHKGNIRRAFSINNAEAQLLQAKVPRASLLCYKTLQEVIDSGIRIGTVMRRGEILFPSKSFQFEAEDEVILIAASKELAKVDQMFSIRADIF